LGFKFHIKREARFVRHYRQFCVSQSKKELSRSMSIKVINVGDRIRVFAMFGLLGFVAGIVANFTAKYAIPWLTMLVFPNIGLEWVLSGFAGAFLTVLLVTVWAYVTATSEP